MIQVKDIMLDDNNDLTIRNGDFDVQYSDGQHVKLILLSELGAWRQEPLVGIGIRRMLNIKLSDIDRMLLRKQIAIQLQYDGYAVQNVSLTASKKLSVDYERI